jgi:hypothetical protein
VPVRPFFVREVRRGDEMLFQTEVEAAPAAFSEEVPPTPRGRCRRSCSAAPDGPRSSTAVGRPRARPAPAPTTRTRGSSGSRRSCRPPSGSATPTRDDHVDGVEVTGGGLSSRIWKGFTDAALAGQPELDLPEPVYAGTRARFDDDVEQVSRRAHGAREPSAPETTEPVEATLEPEPAPPAEEPVEVPEPEETEPAGTEPSSAAVAPSPG